MNASYTVTPRGLSYRYKDADGEVWFGTELHTVRMPGPTVILYKEPDLPAPSNSSPEWLDEAYRRVLQYLEDKGLKVIQVA